jgi:hypothetical protein
MSTGRSAVPSVSKEEVDAELDPRQDVERLHADLIILSVRRELGQISEDEDAAQEAALLEQLNALQVELRGDTQDVGGS